MSKIRIVATGVVGLFVILFAIYVWSGGFFTPVILEAETGPMLFVGLPHKGSYKKISSKFTESAEKASSLKLVPEPMAGIYFDDPSFVNEEQLRSYAGFLTDQKTADTLISKFPEFRVIAIPKQVLLKSEFPNQGIVSMFLAIQKVYPKFGEYFKEKNLVMQEADRASEKNFAMEIYNKDKIEFYMTIPK